MPITAIAFTISLLALAGVPPLNGFWSKLVLFGAAINSGPLVSWGPYLAIAGVLNSALSLGYYAWIIRKMYMEEAPDMSKVKEPRAMVAVLTFAMIFIVGFGVWHAPILEFASKAVPHFGNNGNNNNLVVPASTSSRHFGNNNNNILVQATTTPLSRQLVDGNNNNNLVIPAT
jgi:formate hydrogenlyase subunit 3/multisubunit Na+/H+ antiporter MnhD subunit